MELSITTLQQLAQDAALLRDLVLLHCYSRYSGLQCQGTQSHYIAAAGTVDCSTTRLSFCTSTAGTICYSTKGVSHMTLLLLVQQVAVPGDLVSLHCYSWYNMLQYQGTQSHDTATTGTAGSSTRGLGLSGLLQYQEMQSQPHC